MMRKPLEAALLVDFHNIPEVTKPCRSEPVPLRQALAREIETPSPPPGEGASRKARQLKLRRLDRVFLSRRPAVASIGARMRAARMGTEVTSCRSKVRRHSSVQGLLVAAVFTGPSRSACPDGSCSHGKPWLCRCDPRCGRRLQYQVRVDARAIAASDFVTSSSVVDQLLTEIRSTRRPCQVDPLIQAVPSSSSLAST